MTDPSRSALGSRRPRLRPWVRVTLALAGTAQVDDLAGRCLLVGTAGSALECEQFALATRLAQAGAGLAQTGGNPFTGSASTLGRRFGVSPRVALSARASVVRFPVLAVYAVERLPPFLPVLGKFIDEAGQGLNRHKGVS